jgi:penicillin-binding protein 1A
MIDILRAVINGGTGAALRYTHGLGANIDIGGKTGTTQNNSDGWFVGFTPQFCLGVWVGHADRNVHFMSTLYGQGAAMALPIWGYTMKAVYEDPELAVRPRAFEAPEELRVETDCLVFQRTNGNTGCGSEGSSGGPDYLRDN